MSYVTTVVVVGTYVPREAVRMLSEGYHDGERTVSFRELSGGGGTKGPVSGTYGGAYNYLDADRLVEWLRTVPWYGDVMLVVMPEDGRATYQILGEGSADTDNDGYGRLYPPPVSQEQKEKK